jgi:hypothetical protein
MIDDNDPRSTYAFHKRLAAMPTRRQPPEIPPPRRTRSSSPWVEAVRRLGDEGRPWTIRQDLYESQLALRQIARGGDLEQLAYVYAKAGDLDSPAMADLIRHEIRDLMAWTPLTVEAWRKTW